MRFFGGPDARPIELHAPDPNWPQRFERERERIAGALGALALRIEHIGSTAVPGLWAKPVIDVLVEAADPLDERLRERLESAGYALRVDEPGHRMFRTQAMDVHVHLWREGSDDVARHLLFRDRLRASPEDRDLYERVKRELAEQRWNDRNEYAEAKSPVIAEIVRRASRG